MKPSDDNGQPSSTQPYLLARGESLLRGPWEQAVEFTRVYQANRDKPIAERELACLRVQFPSALLKMQPGDLIAGRVHMPPIGFSPEPGGFAYYCQSDACTKAIADGTVAEPLRKELADAVAFWQTESTEAKTRAEYPASLTAALPSERWTVEPGIAFPLYRLAGAYLDFDQLVKLGLPGLKARTLEAAAMATDPETKRLHLALADATQVVADACLAYAEQIRTAPPMGANGDDLAAAEAALRAIAVRAPASFHEAMQLIWLYGLVAGVQNVGRLDVYVGDLLVADLKKGVLTENRALQLTQSLWRLIAARHTIYNGRVIIGGMGRRNPENADRFAKLAMEATRTVKEIEPQLSLRFHRDQDPALYDQALDCIGEGRTYPMLYNDDVNVPAVMRAFDLPRKEAEHYLPFGCGEYVIANRSVGTPSGVINLLQALQVTLFGGRDPISDQPMGLTGPGLEGFDTFDDLWNAYARQVEYHVAALAEQESIEYRVAGETAPFLLLSLLYDDCVARGKGIFAGGVRYLGGTIETYGNTNTADSLTAIKSGVFEKRTVAKSDLLAAIKSGFDANARLRGQLLKAPKYGNDDDAADGMLQRVHEHVCLTSRNQAERVGLHSYLVVVINNWANTIFGRQTAASPDGRLAGEPFANANNPSSGSDHNGVTAFLSSLVKPESSIHAGAVQNMKFSKDLFTRHRDKLKSMLAGFFSSGGTQAMITVVSKQDLQAALAEPHKWGHLMVRVGGFTARFVELPRKAQEEILARTLY